MIIFFHLLLHHIFVTQAANLRPNPGDPLGLGNEVDDRQVGFEPPDGHWQNDYMSDITPLQALNVYLVDLRENRKLRSNERNRVISEGVVMDTPAPRRIDCHYLITAWSPVRASPSTDPTLDEARLLYEVTRVLMHNEPLNPSRIYPTGSVELGRWPEPVRDCDIPIQVLPPEGFPKLAEFWGTMGEGHRWKPAVYMIATLPVLEEPFVAGPPVTTRIAEYRRADNREPGEVLAAIGGRVLDGSLTPPSPVAWAKVQLERQDGAFIAATQSDSQGRFIFERLPLGPYQLRCWASGFAVPLSEPIEIPSPTGEYDLIFV
jgi:hypothetical protein